MADLLGDVVHTMRATTAFVNAEPAILMWVGDRLDTVVVFGIADQQISGLRLIRNPHKLAFIAAQPKPLSPAAGVDPAA
jgi:hypothetical protein